MDNILYNDKGFLTKDYPHGTFPFHLITLKDYKDAMMRGMEVEKAEMEQLLSNPDTPTFKNTIVALERSGDLLGQASDVFFNLTGTETNDEMDELAEEMSPILADHSTSICFDPRLFKRVKYVYDYYHTEHPEEYSRLDIEDRRLLDDTYEGLVRSGAALDETKKARLTEISNEMSLLDLKFSQNKLKEINAFSLHITDEADLEGLPESAIDAARQTAKDRKKDGWIITLKSPSMSPFMTYSARRELRKKVWTAYNTICTHDNNRNNFEVVRKIVNLSQEEAQLTGYKCYADFVLEERMAKNQETVYNLLKQLIDAYKPTALKEFNEIRQFAKEIEGEDFELEPWDMSYYSNKLQEKLYNINSEMLRPYFELEKVKNGVFGLATRLYGITFEKNPNIPVYHPEVEAFDVIDKDGKFLAVLYCDFHPRDGKKSGAWMTTFQGQYIEDDGTDVRPQILLVMNFTRPTDTRPSLLTLGEVETFLHEFGHSLHEMFSECKYAELSGTNVYWDFVELPSQLMENFSVEKEFLKTFARHYQTGEEMPDELIQRIIDSRNFGVALGCLRQVSFGLLDMAYYTLTEPLTTDIMDFERNAWKDAVINSNTYKTCMSVQFSHIMAGGYAAGYYSYKWAEMLDADAFEVFRQNGLFNRETAERFRREILSRGATEHPMTLYKRFRGQEPTIEAMLKRNGIKQ